MIKKSSRDALRRKRHARLRLRVSGSTQRPRLNVFRSSRFIYAQVIDDTTGRTLAAASSREPSLGAGTGKIAVAQAGITQVVLDRGGYRYHGRVRSLAEGARQGGLEL
jgi:large subunit ribosomal protein L18